tara:strand:- start:362 stop:757 length:396 start_codon:yes stop_codon:yes gene_type:complete
MSEYKENIDAFDTEEELQEEEVQEEVEQLNEGPALGADLSSANELDDEVETAVLLILKKSGAVLPVSDLDNLKMERKATAHDVLRMCADVQDQVSSIRVVGELAQIFQHLTQENLKAVAQLLSNKMKENIH